MNTEKRDRRWPGRVAAAAALAASLVMAVVFRVELRAWFFPAARGPSAAVPSASVAVVASDPTHERATLELAVPGAPPGTSVTVDGVAAAPSGTADRWRLEVAVPLGAREITVAVVTRGGSSTARWTLAAGTAGVAVSPLGAASAATAAGGAGGAAPGPGETGHVHGTMPPPASSATAAPAAALAGGPFAALPGAALPGDEEVDHWTCTMHPSVHALEPGTCPICGMTLVPVTKGDLRTGTVRFDPVRLPALGVRIGVVDRRPMHRHIRAVGRVEYDETRLHDVTLKYGGFVKRLVADTTGKKVKRGELLMTVYSPEVYAAESEMVEIAKALGKEGALAAAARRKLTLWDLPARFLDEALATGKPHDAVPVYAPADGVVVEKSVVAGSPVTASTPLMRIGALDAVWVLADLYEAELPSIDAGLPVSITLRALPGRVFEGKVSYVYPYLNGATRTLRLRVELTNTDGALRPDMLAHVELAVPLGERLVVADSAVVYTGERRLVFVDVGGGRMQPREVRLGLKLDGGYEVLAGLAEGERVVESGNFLIAAESRIKSALERW
ncbi:MAG TPA: efflux RND transporter periplasmic adaptor subunit [Myxococcota bacterium]|jgi:Cu(I)/Ag(I) efflux system membrane fusion protein|nr:efflux RND transporter periplasmic adaptor subunit [Myxococcota bacterium]